MKKEFKKFNLPTLFLILTFLVVSVTWVSAVLLEFSIFYKEIVFISLVFIILAIYWFIRRVKVVSFSKADLIILLIVLFFAAFNTFYFHDNFSGSRDDSVLSIVPPYIISHHTSTINNETNIPGWMKMKENNFAFQSYPGYPAYLSVYYAIAGFTGIRISNFLLIIISLLSIYFIGKELKDSRVGLFSVLLFATSFPMFWFTRRTYTEIPFMSFLWSFIVLLFFAYKKKNNFILFFSLADLMLLSMIRFEGLIIATLVFIFAIFLKTQKADFSWIAKKKAVSLIIILFIPIFFYNLYLDPTKSIFDTPINFYKETSFQISKMFTQKNISQNQNSSLNSFNFDTSERTQMRFHFTDYIRLSLAQYNLFLPMIFMLVIFLQAILFFRKKRNLKILFIFFIGLQTYAYFANPWIGTDHPWILRRYLFFLIPLSFICLSLFLEELFTKYKKFIFPILLLAISLNIIISKPILFFRENEGMLEKTEELSRNFSSNDLLFVDRYATDRYKIGSTLAIAFDKNSYWVWEGMPCLNFSSSKYNNIYLIAHFDNTSVKSLFGSEYLKYKQEFLFPYKYLVSTVDLHHIDLPDSYGDIFDFEYEFTKTLLKVPNKITKSNYKVIVYEIDKSFFKYDSRSHQVLCPK